MAQDIITVENVHGFVDEKGTVWLNVEDVARGLGFVEVKPNRVATCGDKYSAIRWARINGYLAEFDYPPVKAGDFIPENIFYRLAMKANNETAKNFQAKVADEILPAIRKHGVYMTTQAAEKILFNPDFIIKLAQQVKDAQAECKRLQGEVATLKPKADYCEIITSSDEAIPITVIAKDYGMSAKALNKILCELKIQHKAGKTWVLNQPYIRRGYTVSVTTAIGQNMTAINTYWTQKGRMWLYETLKKNRIVPMVERPQLMDEMF